MSKSLYERLGGSEGITAIASDAVENHLKNKAIATRYESHEVDKLKHGAATFFIAGTGGPDVYEGKDMLSVHKGMNISHEEFMEVLDDILDALDKNDVGENEKQEVLSVLYSMRKEIVRV